MGLRDNSIKVSETDALNNGTIYMYDSANRVTQVNWKRPEERELARIRSWGKSELNGHWPVFSFCRSSDGRVCLRLSGRPLSADWTICADRVSPAWSLAPCEANPIL